MTNPIQYISPQEFRDEGYLQEVNRRFFHPLGLAVEMVSNKAGEDPTAYAIVTVDDLETLIKGVFTTDKERTETFERVRKGIMNADRAIFSGVWDYRDDPEGMYFVNETEEEQEAFAEKAQHITDLWNERKRPRTMALKYMIQPSGNDHFTELGSDIVALLGAALGEEMSKVIPVKATSESWNKAARGVLDKLSETISGQPYNPDEVTAEEVHIIDLVLMPLAGEIGNARSRVEAVNMLVDKSRFYKEVFDQASADLGRIARGDFPPGMSPQDFADQALANLAGDLGG